MANVAGTGGVGGGSSSTSKNYVSSDSYATKLANIKKYFTKGGYSAKSIAAIFDYDPAEVQKILDTLSQSSSGSTSGSTSGSSSGSSSSSSSSSSSTKTDTVTYKPTTTAKVTSLKASYSSYTSTAKITWNFDETKYKHRKEFTVEYWFRYMDGSASTKKSASSGIANGYEISINEKINKVYYRVKPIPDTSDVWKKGQTMWSGEWSTTAAKSSWPSIDVNKTLTKSELDSSKIKTLKMTFKESSYEKNSKILRINWNAVNTKTYKHVDHLELQYTFSNVYRPLIDTNYQTATIDKSATKYELSIPDNSDYAYYRIRAVPAEGYELTSGSYSGTSWKKNETLWKPEWSHPSNPSNWKKTSVITSLKPTTPSVPTLTVSNKYKLTASVDYYNDTPGISSNGQYIEFQIYDVTDKVVIRQGEEGRGRVSYRHAATTIEIQAGHKYKARARAICVSSSTSSQKELISDWSEFSDGETQSIPASITGTVTVTAMSSTSVRIEYKKAAGATSYEVEYTSKREYFDTSTSNVQSATSNTTTCIITGLDTGSSWFFRVRAVNEQGNSKWTKVVSVILGKPPGPPTTWSNITTAKVGDTVNLYWVHNSMDGSSQAKANVVVYLNGAEVVNTEVINTTDEDKKDDTQVFKLSTAGYPDSSVITWKVRTMGVLNAYGEWSATRSIDVFAPPTIALQYSNVNNWIWNPFNFDTDDIYTAIGDLGDPFDVLRKYPVYLKTFVGPVTQTPIGYTLKVISNSDYEHIEIDGETTYISKGDEIYSENFDITGQLLTQLTPDKVVFETGCSYTIEVMVVTNAGLSAQTSFSFYVEFDEPTFRPDMTISYNQKRYITYLSPICLNDDGSLNNSIFLSVYRINHDGSLTMLADRLSNMSLTTIVDEHPTMTAAKYRVVGVSNVTGDMQYTDVMVGNIFESAIILQWNQKSYNFYGTDEDDDITRAAGDFNSGPFLKLRYNIELNEDSDPDVELIEYAGRENPVSYYGTQLGIGMTLKTDVPKEDKETIFQLRRLSRYQGDVYVREPSGLGYWAQVGVSFGIKYNDLVVPVTLNIKKVEGGA